MYGYYREKLNVDHFWELKGNEKKKERFLYNHVLFLSKAVFLQVICCFTFSFFYPSIVSGIMKYGVTQKSFQTNVHLFYISYNVKLLHCQIYSTWFVIFSFTDFNMFLNLLVIYILDSVMLWILCHLRRKLLDMWSLICGQHNKNQWQVFSVIQLKTFRKNNIKRLRNACKVII